MKNQRRKVTWDRGGVSEVIGTILTLTITVVLFSSIIAMVDQFPAPGDNVYTDFTATIEPRDNWNNGARIHITNTGGQQLEGMWGLIAITIDSNTYSLGTKGVYDNTSYGLGIPLMPGHSNDNGDDTWDTGERWTFYRNQTYINQNSAVSVIILDQGRGALVWSAQIQGKQNKFGPIISNIRVDSDLRSLRSDPIAFGREFYIFAEVYDPDGDLDMTSVTADLSSFLGPGYFNIPMTFDGDGVFRAGPLMGPMAGTVPVGYHIAIIRANDNNGMRSTGSARVAVGIDLENQPNLVISSRDISVSTLSPVNGQTVTISVTVKNYGGWCNANLSVYDIVGSNVRKIGMVNFTVSQGPTQITRAISWVANPGGEHIIRAEALPLDCSDYDYRDNSNYTEITVLPRILLVDDDNYPPDLSDMDTASYMRASLESSDFSYDLYIVGPHMDGPGYLLGQKKMIDYDVIIWMTGYETVKTLTIHDQQNLTKYLNDDIGRGRGGSLWMIGQYLYSDSDVPGAFFTDVLKASAFQLSASGPTNPLMGILGNPVSDEWNSTYIPMENRVPAKESSYRIIPDPSEPNAEMTFREPDPVVYADAINYENPALDSRLVFCPWEFSRIKDSGDQTQVAYRVLNWLGNITLRQGNDLAVSEQVLDPNFVFFNQQVTVDAVIRNNGQFAISTQVGLFLDERNEPIAWISSLEIPGKGQSVTVTANWTAKELGKHVLKWKVDPNNLIDETNENNNEVPGYITTGEVFVEFRILVVDDDSSINNNGALDNNDTAYITDSLHRLGYTYESPNGVNTTYIVPVGGIGPDLELLKDYSAVIWVCGNSPAGLNFNDTANLENYIRNYKGLLWLSGNDLWSGVAGANLSADMGIASVVTDTALPSTLRGVDDSPISHGMNISIAPNPASDVLEPSPSASGVFYQSFVSHRYCAVMYEDINYKGFTSAFNISTLYDSNVPGLLTGDNATDEFVYMLLRWFGKPETRSEVRITERDFTISDWHPQIGGAYIIRATVHNVGVNDANLLVRFMDGTVQVGSDSISITPGARTTAEIIWRPLFAGMRTISIQIDPVNEVDEVFQWFNNNRTFNVYVYFFWDDMESGASKWFHASTIIKINGEAALDYFGSYTTMNTDISTTWNASRSYGTEIVTNTAHSYPNSYYMHEGVGLFGKADVLVSFALDDSKSMTQRIGTDGRTFLEAAKDATLSLLEELSDDSVCVSIWDFKGNNERRWSGPTARIPNDPAATTVIPRDPIRLGDIFIDNVTGVPITGRELVRKEITDMDNPSGTTILWDAIGEAYLDTLLFANPATYPQYVGLMPVVIALSDGADSQASDQSAIASNRIEGGSDYWAPWGHESEGIVNYPEHRGKYTFDWANPGSTTQWLRAMTHGGSMSTNRVGLLSAGMRIFTIGLGLEDHENPWEPVRTVWPGEIMDNFYATCTGPGTKESGTLEYNLWRIANTTGAMYFHAPSGDELDDIFTQLGMYLATGFNQTRSSTPEPETRAVHNNADKRAVTEEFSLVDIEKATLSFWQKYNILQGGNGAFLQVGYKESANGEWKYKYMTPPGQYTGMLFYEYNVYDDFGNLIRWGWNGISDQGSFDWDYINLDISSYVPQGFNALDGHVYRSQVCIAFNYTQFGGGTNVGWYIDDVQLEVTRSNAANITSESKDLWRMIDDPGAHSGTHCWNNIDPVTGDIKPGIDNYLMTAPIDLTNARTAYLSAYFRFNFNQQSAAPPDGFRVEVTTDGGLTWIAINLGVRSAWGVSGMGPDIEDTVIDGRSYTGITDTGDAAADNYWVSAGTLNRLNIDLSAWSGNQIYIRFRMVSNNLPDYLYSHNNNAFSGDPGFGGFCIDDVNVYGETIFG